jgi:hypothetical protein
VHEAIRRERIASKQERANSELDAATMVMLLDCGMSLKDIAECFKLEVKTVERLIVEHQRARYVGFSTRRANFFWKSSLVACGNNLDG